MTRLPLAAALAAALASPLPAFAQDAATVLATVDGTEITLGHLVALRGRLPAQYQQLADDVLFEAMLDQVIQQQVLADAMAGALTPGDEIGLENETRAFVAGLLIADVAGEEIADGALQAAYESEYGGVEAGTEYNADHILVATQEAAQAVKDAVDGGADFAEQAREASTGPSGPNGGQLGWFGAGMMVPEFEAAVAELAPGAVSDPVQTQFGWHVIRLNETREQAAPSLEEVSGALEEQIRQSRVEARIAELMDGAAIDRPEVEVDPALIRDDALLTE